MKLTLENFGPIRKFELDLSKKLSLIYGKNSVGKSYAVYVAYSLLKILSDRGEFGFFWAAPGNLEEKWIDDETEKLNARARAAKGKPVSCAAQAEKLLALFLNWNLVPRLEDSLQTTFSAFEKLDNSFGDKRFSIELEFDLLSFRLERKNGKSLKVDQVRFSNEPSVVFVQESSSSPAGFSLIYGRSGLRQLGTDSLLNTVFLIIDELELEVDRLVSEVYFLPASRSGLYAAIDSFSAIIAELSKSRMFLRSRKFELPSLSESTADYFLHLSTIDGEEKSDVFSAIARSIETRILGGEIRFNDKTKKFRFAPKGTNIEIDLSHASSMVMEIAPIVSFLKYVLANGGEKRLGLLARLSGQDHEPPQRTLLIIEEPEAHLHPSAQILLMVVFAELAKVGVKIIMTSHSNYMFNKLGNLILAGKIAAEDVGSYHLKMGSKGSFDKGDMKATSDGIEDHNFVDVSEQLYDERMAMYEKMAAQDDASETN